MATDQSQWLKRVYEPPTLGRQDRLSPLMCNIKEAPILENWMCNWRGVLEKVPGYIKDGSPFPNSGDSFIRMLLNLRRGSTYDVLLMAAQDNGNANAQYKVDLKLTPGDGSYSYLTHVSDVPNIPTNALSHFINGNTGVTGTDTDWLTSLAAGDFIKNAADIDADYTQISSVNSNTSLTLVAGGYLGNTGVNVKYLIKAQTYTASFTGSNTTVTGQFTKWASQLKAGDKIKAQADADTAYTEIASVNSNTSITLVGGGYLGSTHTTAAYAARVILNKSAQPAASTLNDKAIITNGSDTPMTFDGTTVSLITNPNCPKAPFIETHKNRVFMADGSSVFWSGVTDEQFWSAASTEDIFPQDGGDIVAIKSFADSLVVLKSKGAIYQIFGNFDDSDVGTPDFIRKVDLTDNVGNIASRSPVVHNNYLFFFAATGLYRMDFRGWVEKVSYQVNNLTDEIQNSSGPIAAKSFNTATASQWNAGTYGSPISTRVSVNSLQGVCDLYTKSNCLQADGMYAVAQNAAGTLAVAYLSSDSSTIKCVKYSLQGVETDYDVVSGLTAGQVFDISIDMTSNEDIVVGYMFDGHPAESYLQVVECPSGGTFGSPQQASDLGGFGGWGGTCSVKYSAGGTSTIYAAFTFQFSGNGAYYIRFSMKVGGVWSTSELAGQANQTFSGIDLDVSGSTFALTCVFRYLIAPGNFSVRMYTSTDSGATWTPSLDIDIVSSGGDINNKLRAFLTPNAAPSFSVFVPYQDKLYKVAYDTASPPVGTKTTEDSSAHIPLGAHIYSGSLIRAKVNSSGTDTLVFSGSITDAIGSQYTSTFFRPGGSCLATNGTTTTYAYFGASANSLLIRRVAPIGVYTGHEFFDSTLTAWGTFIVTNQQNNGQTVLTQVAVGSGSNPSSFANINSGNIINSNPSLNHIVTKVTFTLSSFAAPSIDGITLNYTGTGATPAAPLAATFRNELYLAYAPVGDLANSHSLVLDLFDKYFTTTYPVSALGYYKGSLYAGHSGKGDLLVLRDGYTFAGSAYTADCFLKEDLLDSIELEKELGRVYVLYETKQAGTTTISYRLDNFTNPSGSAFTNVSIDLTGNGLQEFLIGKKARSVQFRLNDSGLGNSPGIIGVILLYRYLNVR